MNTEDRQKKAKRKTRPEWQESGTETKSENKNFYCKNVELCQPISVNQTLESSKFATGKNRKKQKLTSENDILQPVHFHNQSAQNPESSKLETVNRKERNRHRSRSKDKRGTSVVTTAAQNTLRDTNSVLKKKRKRKKCSFAKETLQPSDIQNHEEKLKVHNLISDTHSAHSAVQKKRRKRNRNKSWSRLVTSENVLNPSHVPEAEGAVHTVTKTLKKSPAVRMENNPDLILTVGNYPKDLSSKNGFSCNWKKLCQTINKPATVTGANHHTAKEKSAAASHSAKGRTRHGSRSMTSEIWFDGVDKDLLEPSTKSTKTNNENRLVKDGSFKGLTNCVAMDCEMVGTGENGTDSMLARVSIVNLMGNCIYDKYVKPTDPVTDYRTAVSGIRPSDLEKGEDFKVVQKEVSDILDKRILVGHAVHNDLKVLFLSHPRKRIRDTASYKYFRSLNKGNTPSLKCLAEKVLGVKVQEGEHNSIQDAQATMRLYTMHKIDWEKSIKKKRSKCKNAEGKTSPPKKSLSRKFSQLKI